MNALNAPIGCRYSDDDGHHWATRSNDDGKTWEATAPTPLVHPDAPPMLFHLSDGKTLAAFHHNRHHDTNYVNLGENPGMQDRSEIWVSLSTDGGRRWSEPRFVFANAAFGPLGGRPEGPWAAGRGRIGRRFPSPHRYYG